MQGWPLKLSTQKGQKRSFMRSHDYMEEAEIKIDDTVPMVRWEEEHGY